MATPPAPSRSLRPSWRSSFHEPERSSSGAAHRSILRRSSPAPGPFRGKEALLSPGSRRVPAQPASLGDDAMAGKDDEDGVRRDRVPDGARGSASPEISSELLIEKGLSQPRIRKPAPDGQLPRGADRRERDRKLRPLAGKIVVKLGPDLPKTPVRSRLDGATEEAETTLPLGVKLRSITELEQSQTDGIGHGHHASQRGADSLLAEAPPDRHWKERRRRGRPAGPSRAAVRDLGGPDLLPRVPGMLSRPRRRRIGRAGTARAHERRIARGPLPVQGRRPRDRAGISRISRSVRSSGSLAACGPRAGGENEARRAGGGKRAPTRKKSFRNLVKRACQACASSQ